MTWKRGHSVNVLDEEHHRIYGSKWALGLDQFKYLKSLGLNPEHKLLDFGCGAGRAGIHLIRYLETGNYVGVDGHAPSINAFRDYELVLNDLVDKQPEIQCTDLEKEAINYKDRFDYVLSFSVFNHMNNHELAMRSLALSVKTGGHLLSSFAKPTNFEKYGFMLIKSESCGSMLVSDKLIDWYVFKKIS